MIAFPRSEVLTKHFGDIHQAIVNPWEVALQLFQEGVVGKEVLGEVMVSNRSCSEKTLPS